MGRKKGSPISHLLFLITYNTIYFFLGLLLVALALISPTDIIIQALHSTFQFNNIIIIAIAYAVTVLIVLFVYALRLYVTRTVLTGIPKNWIPVQKGEVERSVWEMITRDASKSAAIAWKARPKIVDLDLETREGSLDAIGEEGEEKQENQRNGWAGSNNAPATATEKSDGTEASNPSCLPFPWPRLKKEKMSTAESELGIALPATLPVWGQIEHFGWGSPNSPDLPNLQYSAVLAELPNLIEAKAVSLAPFVAPDPGSPESGFKSDRTTRLDSGSNLKSEDTARLRSPGKEREQPALDPEAVELLQRTGNMSMREYVVHLTSLGVVPSLISEPSADRGSPDHDNIVNQAQNTADFLDTYERARFSTRPLSNEAFRRLMHLFAEVLRSMQPLDPTVLDTMREMDGMYAESGGYSQGGSLQQSEADGDGDIDDDAPKSFSSSIAKRSQSTGGENHYSPSRRPNFLARNSSQGTRGQYGTAPTTPQSKSGRSGLGMTAGGRVNRSPSGRSEASLDSFAQTRQPFMAASTPSSGRSQLDLRRQVSEGASFRSLGAGSIGTQRSQGSNGSDGSSGSVIRLARREDDTDLPYVLNVANTF